MSYFDTDNYQRLIISDVNRKTMTFHHINNDIVNVTSTTQIC